MLELVRESLGVYRSSREMVHVSKRHSFFLRKVAEHSPGLRSRILLSPAGAAVRQELIFHYPGAEGEMHAHGGGESTLVVYGGMKFEFEDRPTVFLRQHELLWVPAGVAHRASPHDWTVILETEVKK